MSITYNQTAKTFFLKTKNSSYVMKISDFDNLLHLYYGAPIPDENLDYLIQLQDRGFSPNPFEAGNNRSFSLDFLPQEFSTNENGDYRSSSIEVQNPDGSRTFSGKVTEYHIEEGKHLLETMPSLRAGSEDTVHTLTIRLTDEAAGLCADLIYSVFEEKDVITRSVLLTNSGSAPVKVGRLMSATLDFMESDYDLIYFAGRHTMEREEIRIPVERGIHSIGSTRGTSSHQYNPSAILCAKGADEDQGKCYGFSLIYSGNFLIEAEKDQYSQLRLNAGINPKGFSYALAPGESLEAPEMVLAFTCRGLTALSHIYHDVYRENLCRSPYVKRPRPVLINSWEAAYFDFDEEKLLNIAKNAAQMGVELFVLDDGWFGKRNNDSSSLGDWTVNRAKLKHGLKGLSDQIHNMGLSFGLWIEPEMVSEDSDLYRAHPDWCLRVPGRPAVRGRYQLVLDLSRPDVCRYLADTINHLLSEARIEYIKWDMNRSLSDAWSGMLDRNSQGEVYHKYILGLYRIMDEVILTHPDVIFCGCSGGGGRYDPGMYYYQPQIWCSDNTDAISRLKIQYGTSFIYPMSALESHVSICPNHQTGRTVSLKTRGIVAMDGIFGYELDSTRLSEDEKAQCRAQVQAYKRFEDLILTGDYYRLTSPYTNPFFTAWQYVSKDKRRAVVSLVLTDKESNDAQRFVKPRGLLADAFYQVDGTDRVLSGSLLMNAGIPIPFELKEYEGIQFGLTLLEGEPR